MGKEARINEEKKQELIRAWTANIIATVHFNGDKSPTVFRCSRWTPTPIGIVELHSPDGDKKSMIAFSWVSVKYIKITRIDDDVEN